MEFQPHHTRKNRVANTSDHATTNAAPPLIVELIGRNEFRDPLQYQSHFSELDFVSMLVLRYHFPQFKGLCYAAIEGIALGKYAGKPGKTFLKLLKEQMEIGIVVIGILRRVDRHSSALPGNAHKGLPGKKHSREILWTNPPADTRLLEGDRLFFYASCLLPSERGDVTFQ